MTAFLDMAIARAAAEALMSSTCTITRDGEGAPVWDEATGKYVPPARVPIYSGKCRIRPAATWGREVSAGEAEAVLSAFRVQLPFSVIGVGVGQLLHVDDSPDPALSGRDMVIRFIPEMGDHITARRLTCEAA